MAIRRQVPWARQPQIRAEIDYSNPLTRGLILCINSAVGPVNLANKGTLAFVGSTFDKAVSSGGVYLNTNVSNYMTYTPPATLTGATLFSIEKQVLSGGAQGPWYTNSSNYDFAPYSGNVFYFNTFANARYVAGAAAPSGIDWNAFTVCCRGGSTANSHAAFVNGVLLGTTNSPFVCDATIRIGDNFFSASDQGYLRLMWDRPLSDGEIASISANPWQVFRPLAAWAIAAAAGAFLAAAGTSLGSSLASGSASSRISSGGTAVAASLASGASSKIASSTGLSSGAALAAGTGAALFSAGGTAIGAATVFGFTSASSVIAAQGVSLGAAVASGAGAARISSAAVASGSAFAAGSVVALSSATGVASASSLAVGSASGGAGSSASASGLSLAFGGASALISSTGASTATSLALAASAMRVSAAGTASATSFAQASSVFSLILSSSGVSIGSAVAVGVGNALVTPPASQSVVVLGPAYLQDLTGTTVRPGIRLTYPV